MRVYPYPGDTPEILTLMADIDFEWKEAVRLRKEFEAAQKREGLLRAKLRLLLEGLVEGERLVLTLNGQQGVVEVSADAPYLWLRLTDKAGGKAKRRLKLEENTRVARIDGSVPEAWEPNLTKKSAP